jgi:hypothetical protein
MTAHDDGPTPEAQRSPWSNEDKRALIISFVGGLAANIGLVFAVGGAVAIDHIINNSSFNRNNFAYIYFAILGGSAIISALVLLVYQRRRARQGRHGLALLFKIYIWGYLGLAGISLLIFLGVAAGVGK